MEISIDRVEFKKEAKKLLDGRTWILCLCNLCFLLITIALASFVFFIPNPLEKILTDFIYTQNWTQITLPLIYITLDVEWICWGIYMFFRSIIFAALIFPFYVCLATIPLMIVNNEKIKLNAIFKPVSKARYFIEYAICGVETYLFTLLWALLLIVPGVMAHYKFSYSRYVLATKEDITAGEAIEISKKYTIGNRGILFNLDLSFLGWFIIGIVTCGLGLIFAVGYHEVVSAMYFKEISKTVDAETNEESEERTSSLNEKNKEQEQKTATVESTAEAEQE